MEGLEISEVLLSAVVSLTRTDRMDAEFYSKANLATDRLLNKRLTFRLADIAIKIDVGFVGSMTAHYCDVGVPLLQTKNIAPFLVDDAETVLITPAFHLELHKSQIKYEDILIARSGSFGKASIYLKHGQVNSSDIIIIQVDKNQVSPYFLNAFLNSSLGASQMIRFASGGVQGHVNLTILEELRIPALGVGFQTEIENQIRSAHEAIEKSASVYFSAESLLIESLGLTNVSLSGNNVNIKSFNDSFASAGRLDAEHYQPKYDELQQALVHYPGGTTTVGDLAREIANGAEVREYQETGTPYLRVGDLRFLDIDGSSVVKINPLSAESGLEKIGLQTGDVLLSRSGSLAVSAVVESEWEKALISSHLIRLRIVDARLDPYFLALFFMTLPGKMQIQRWSNGGVQPEISQPALKAIVVPIPPMAVQHKIRDSILKARQLRARSDHLLEAAKRAVEIAIEKDEVAGLAYLEREGAMQ